MRKSFSGHFHTIVGAFLPFPKLADPGERHVIELPDGDRVVGSFFAGPSNVIVSLYHGLSGDRDADYMQRTAVHYMALGHSVFLVNHRGVGEGAGLAQKPYHSGRGDDVGQVVNHLRHLFPEKKQITVGFSISGNIILSLLCGQSGVHLPDAAITVNAPIDLGSCAVALSQGLNRIYDLRFVRRLKAQKNLDISSWAHLFEVDDIYTAPLSGFRDRHHYYESCSTKLHVQNIRVPTCVLAAEDDPFIPVQHYREARWSESVNLQIHPWGGHLGYLRFRRNHLGSYSWLDEYMVESLNQLIAKIS